MNSCRSSRGPCTTVGDGRNDEAPGWGRTESCESESDVEDGVITGSRSLLVALGTTTLGGGSRSTRASGRRPGSSPGTSRSVSRGIYQVEDVSTGRVLVRGSARDRSDVMRSAMMRGRSPCLELRRPGGHPGIRLRIATHRQGEVQGVQGCGNLRGENVEHRHQVIHELWRQPHGK